MAKIEALKEEFLDRAQALEHSLAQGRVTHPTITTAFGEGSLSPHRRREASMMVAGDKPIAWPDNEVIRAFLIEAADAGLIGMRRIAIADDEETFFFQPGQEQAMDEMERILRAGETSDLHIAPNGADSLPVKVWHEIRQGELFGYEQADIAALLQMQGFDPARFLDLETATAVQSSIPAGTSPS